MVNPVSELGLDRRWRFLRRLVAIVGVVGVPISEPFLQSLALEHSTDFHSTRVFVVLLFLARHKGVIFWNERAFVLVFVREERPPPHAVVVVVNVVVVVVRERRRPSKEKREEEKGKGKGKRGKFLVFGKICFPKTSPPLFWIQFSFFVPLKNKKSIVVVVVMPLPALATTTTTTTTTHRECVETRRFFFGAKESFAEKLEAVKTARSRMTKTVVASCPKGGETAKVMMEEEEKRRVARALALARVVAEWTLSVLPTIVLDVGASDDGKRKKQKKTAAARRQHNFGKAFGSLDEEKEEALRTKANVETLWRTLTDALIICQENDQSIRGRQRRREG